MLPPLDLGEMDSNEVIAELREDVASLLVTGAAFRSVLRRERATWAEERAVLEAQVRDLAAEVTVLRADRDQPTDVPATSSPGPSPA